MNTRIIGIMGAMPEEINGIIHLLSNKTEVSYGKRTYYSGYINDIKTIVVFSRWGKVAAAITVSNLIIEFKITDLIFIGVAGAIHSDLKIGDIVIAKRLIQHDMDARPLMPKYEIPLLGVTYFESDNYHMDIAEKAIINLITNNQLQGVIENADLNEFGIKTPTLFVGDIASGDQFFSTQGDKDNLLNDLPETLCVEMEGAAVAQVCFEYSLPFIIIRTISDESNEKSHIDFPSFINKVSSKYSVEIIKNIFQQLHT